MTGPTATGAGRSDAALSEEGSPPPPRPVATVSFVGAVLVELSDGAAGERLRMVLRRNTPLPDNLVEQLDAALNCRPGPS